MKMLGLAVAVGLTLTGYRVSAQTAASQASKSATPVRATVSETPSVKTTPIVPKTIDKVPESRLSGKSSLPNTIDQSESIKRMLDEIKDAQAKFLEEQKGLQERIKTASDDQRERLRADIQEKREQFMQQQKDMREEFRKRLNELRDQLKDHGELFNDNRQQLRERVRDRRGTDN
ncbi:MAG: hypothetical protein U1G07_23990 [Verrucomicrobiota bacterium]